MQSRGPLWVKMWSFVTSQTLPFAFIWELPPKATGLSDSLLSVGTLLFPLCGFDQAQCHPGSLSRHHRRLQAKVIVWPTQTLASHVQAKNTSWDDGDSKGVCQQDQGLTNCSDSALFP